MVVPVVLIAGIAGGIVLFNAEGGGSEGGSAVGDLTRRAEMPKLTMPDPGKLGFTGGSNAEKMCAKITEILSARGYDLSGVQTELSGAYCNLFTPGLYVLDDGSPSVQARVGFWSGDAVERLGTFLDRAQRDKQAMSQVAAATFSGPAAMPAGEEGFVYYKRLADKEGGHFSGEASAYFRANDYVMFVEVSGSVHRVGKDHEPLEQEQAYAEIAGIVQTLNGASQPIEPLIDTKSLKVHPNLAGVKYPALPEVSEESNAADICAAIEPGLRKLGLELDKAEEDPGPVSVDYVCASPSLMDVGPTPLTMSVWVNIRDYNEDSNIKPAGEMGHDVQSAVRRHGKDGLYGLPFSRSGYMAYSSTGSSSDLEGGFVAGDDLYVEFKISGYRAEDDLVALTGDELTSYLATFLKALN